MHWELSHHTLSGHVLDVGAGIRPEYHALFQQHDNTRIESVDMRVGDTTIDFEKDRLPYDDDSFQSVLVFNVLEHIYNHQFFVSELHRIAMQEGTVIGFVPFFIQYHPDPHDYFRYTQEALERIFTDAGFTNIVVTCIGGGPFLVNFNTIVLSLPRLVRLFAYPVYALCDRIFVFLRPQITARFPLGYFFTLTK